MQFADRSVTYRSIEELLAAESRIARALDAAPATVRRSKQSRLVASKGFNPPTEGPQ